jgi:hypothetical protein
MCKYDSSSSQRYKPVWTALLTLCKELGAGAETHNQGPGQEGTCNNTNQTVKLSVPVQNFYKASALLGEKDNCEHHSR